MRGAPEAREVVVSALPIQVPNSDLIPVIEEVLAGGGGPERTSGRLPKISDADL